MFCLELGLVLVLGLGLEELGLDMELGLEKDGVRKSWGWN